MDNKRPLTGAERQASMKAARAKQGFKRINVYVHENDRREFESFVDTLKKPGGSNFRGLDVTR